MHLLELLHAQKRQNFLLTIYHLSLLYIHKLLIHIVPLLEQFLQSLVVVSQVLRCRKTVSIQLKLVIMGESPLTREIMALTIHSLMLLMLLLASQLVFLPSFISNH